MLNQLRKKAKNTIRFFILSLKSYKLQHAVIICGEARSGSTWLMEIINQIPKTVINWEPLQVEMGVVPKNYNFGWRPFIPESDKTPGFTKLFKGILTYRIYNKWTAKFLKVKGLKNSKYVITKFVRANSLLPWITSQLGDKLTNKPILLIRHPITNCMSQLKTFQGIKGKDLWTEFSEKRKFELPFGINNERFMKHTAYINSLNSVLERTIAIWCVNNAPILNHVNKNRWIEVKYEDLMLNPQDEISKLMGNFELGVDANVFNNFDFGRASASNYKGDFKKDPKIQLEAFLNQFEESYLKKIQRIFDYFELTTYSAFNAYPINKMS